MSEAYHLHSGLVVDPASDRYGIGDVFIGEGHVINRPQDISHFMPIDCSGCVVMAGALDISGVVFEEAAKAENLSGDAFFTHMRALGAAYALRGYSFTLAPFMSASAAHRVHQMIDAIPNVDGAALLALEDDPHIQHLLQEVLQETAQKPQLFTYISAQVNLMRALGLVAIDDALPRGGHHSAAARMNEAITEAAQALRLPPPFAPSSFQARSFIGSDEALRTLSYSEIAENTRAAPAMALGLHSRGNLRDAAIGDVAVYREQADKAAMFSCVEMMFKKGRLLYKKGRFVSEYRGFILQRAPRYKGALNAADNFSHRGPQALAAPEEINGYRPFVIAPCLA